MGKSTKKLDTALSRVLKIANEAPSYVVDTAGRGQINESAIMKTARVETEIRSRVEKRELKKAHSRASRIAKINQSKDTVFDIWGDDIIPDNLPDNKQITNSPAVFKPSGGESVNPEPDRWKQDILHIQAVYNDAHPEANCLACTKPVTEALTQIFPRETILSLTDEQVYRLFAYVRNTQTVPEDPENFLTRTLPLLETTVKPEPAYNTIDDEDSKEQNTDCEAPKTTHLPRFKERKRPGKVRKHERHVTRIEKEKRVASIHRQIAKLDRTLDDIQSAKKEAEQRVQLKKALRENAEVDFDVATGGMVSGHTLLKNEKIAFLDIPKRVASSEALKASKRGFRLAKTDGAAVISDRVASILRRHMIDVGIAKKRHL